jgi:predicted amidohydrolase
MPDESASLTIGAVSFVPQESPRRNLEQICDIARDAIANRIGLVVFPECAVQGYPLGLGVPDLDAYELHARCAEPIPGPATQAIQRARPPGASGVPVSIVPAVPVSQRR